MTREMTGAEMVIEALADQGVKHLFGYPGGAVLPIYDAIFAQEKVQHILVRHEQGAVHAAEGYARSTGKVGCVLVTSGPGATNAVTGLTDALMDSIPIVCITGQVPTHLIGNDAFQEGRHRRHHPAVHQVQLPGQAHRGSAARAARGVPYRRERPARPGGGRHPEGHPVRHRRLFQAEGYSRTPATSRRSRATSRRSRQAVELMAHAKRPLFYTGGGVINSGKAACELLRELVKLTGFPITSTLMGLGAYPGHRSAMAGHARHARHAGSQHGDARLRRDDLHRRALRRPHHRPRRRLLARLEEDPRRHRPVVDQQEHPRRRADRRRLRPRAGRHGAAVARRSAPAPTRRRWATGGSRSTNGARASRSPTAVRTR